MATVTPRHGIIPRAVCEVFARATALAENSPATDVTIICSYLEVYNDHLYDLLQPYKTDRKSKRARVRFCLNPLCTRVLSFFVFV